MERGEWREKRKRVERKEKERGEKRKRREKKERERGVGRNTIPRSHLYFDFYGTIMYSSSTKEGVPIDAGFTANN